MTHVISVNVRNHWHRYLEGAIADRRFASIDDAIEAGLRALEAEEARDDQLGRLLAEGEASGGWEEWDYDKFRAEMKAASGDREAA